MNRFFQRRVGRRSLVRGAAAGALGLGLGLSGMGRFGAPAWAQETTPAAGGFDPESCYQPFAGAETVQYEERSDPPYNIALSNAYIGNPWHTQMIQMARAYAETPQIAPLISAFQVNTADRDDAAQIAAIEDQISNGAQAIVIDANTPTALVPTVEKARADGIVIVSFDNIVSPEPPDPSIDTGITVNEDQVEMGRLWAEWLVEQTGGSGEILMVNGIPGTSVDSDRRQGAYEVWDQHPDISFLEVVGDWDSGKAQTATATALASRPRFAGVWCQGGTDGVVRAFLDAGVPLAPVAGEALNGFRKQMLEYKDQFHGYSIGQSLGLVCVSMRAALSLLMGEPVPRAVAVALPQATTAELAPGVNVFPDAPDDFYPDIAIPECGVNLTFEQIDAHQV